MYIGCRIDIRLEVLRQLFYCSFTVQVRRCISLSFYKNKNVSLDGGTETRRVLDFRVSVRILLDWKYCMISWLVGNLWQQNLVCKIGGSN